GRMVLYQYKKKIISSVSNAIRTFHNAGLYHNDLHIRNILIQAVSQGIKSLYFPPYGGIKGDLTCPARGETGVEFRAYIIDLDKTTHHQSLSFDKRVNNLIRLNRSIDKLSFRFKSLNINNIITASDRLTLLKEYFLGEQLPKTQKADIINRCARHSRLHKLWWTLYGGR
ncbi:MAG: lipopolysaccharide kinase InaA family protein, partial [Planctomycetota bacterium]|nr:lipopolysaccharide kinase InaA family protein [Planctomycetota bacterium]MDI6787666.1 lipopolysaccharide kinase InaA family protein [Planctomycetota bacterium]